MAAHEVYDIEVAVIRTIRNGLVNEREKLLVEDSRILMGIADAGKAMHRAVVRVNLRDIAPDTRAFLIGKPMRLIAGGIHHVNEVAVFIPGLLGLMITKSEKLAEYGNSRGMRTDHIAEHADLTLVVQCIQIRRIRQIVAIEVHMVTVCRLAQNEDDILDLAVVLRELHIRRELGRKAMIGLHVLNRNCRRGIDPLQRQDIIKEKGRIHRRHAHSIKDRHDQCTSQQPAPVVPVKGDARQYPVFHQQRNSRCQKKQQGAFLRSHVHADELARFLQIRFQHGIDDAHTDQGFIIVHGKAFNKERDKAGHQQQGFDAAHQQRPAQQSQQSRQTKHRQEHGKAIADHDFDFICVHQ